MFVDLKLNGAFVEIKDKEDIFYTHNVFSLDMLKKLNIDLEKWDKGESFKVDKKKFYDLLIESKTVFSNWIVEKNDSIFEVLIPFSNDQKIAKTLLDAFEKDDFVEIVFFKPFFTIDSELISKDKITHKGYISLTQNGEIILKYSIDSPKGYILNIDNIKEVKVLKV